MSVSRKGPSIVAQRKRKVVGDRIMTTELRVLTATRCLLVLVIVAFIPVASGAYPVGPNRYLGTCLDSAWVAQMEASLGVSNEDRDDNGQLLYPFLQPALQFPRYRIDDPRTASGAAYTDSCIPKGQVFYGANQDAAGTTRGEADGTLVLDVGDWDSHALVSMVLGIIAQEVSGYKVSLMVGGPTVDITQRMSSARMGLCTPTHLNGEVWTASTLSSLKVYFNESSFAGGIGYFGQTGVYTTRQFVLEGASATPAYFPDFWRHYKTNDVLINEVSVVPFKANPNYNPPAVYICSNGTMGCENNCEKSEACTIREAAGKDCLVVALMYPGYDRAYFQAVLSNLGIPAYFCFLGYEGVNNYAINAAKTGGHVLFLHWEPDAFHVANKGLFDRIALPRTDPERVKMSTANYGENGYGKKTDNPVDVDYPTVQPLKAAASIVKNLPIGSIFQKMSFTNIDINDLLGKYNTAKVDPSEPAPYFRAACNWVKTNYEIWSEWLERLPMCTFEEHIISNVTGCHNGSTVREIHFAWKDPNPANVSLPNSCDGGATLPDTIATSRSCDWIFENRRVWSGWFDTKPVCDTTYYTYNVSDCASDAYRTVQYYWKLSNASNPQLSAECKDGVTLPSDVKINCEYMPTSSSTFAAVAVVAGITAILLVVASILVYKNRNAPIIRRSQYEMLLLMIFGGFFTTSAAVAYAGRPTRLLCGIRPVLLTMGFTTIFGALVMKSWRVYRVFLMAAMKRVKVTLLQIFKMLAIFYIGDIVIFVAWYAADFPEPTITSKEAVEFRGTVDRISCSSSSFIFSALLIFWKAILLMLGLYLSFLIRRVSVDFQESPWIFGSVCVVLMGSLVMMPMSYLVEMPATAYYVFLASALLFCTLFIMGLMLIPKAFRLKESASTATSGSKVASRVSVTNVDSKVTDTDDVGRSGQHGPHIKYQVKSTDNLNTGT